MFHKYRAAPKADLIWHELDSMMLLFHRPSGITHMLADPAPAIIEVMEDDPLTAAEIASRLTVLFDVEAGADAEEIILARLEELSALGLVTRVSG
jgi:PqqD family protein of HPr-rel-A system